MRSRRLAPAGPARRRRAGRRDRAPPHAPRSASAPRPPWGGACRRARRSWRAASCSARTNGSTRRRSKTSAAPASATCSPSRDENVALLALLAMPVLAALRHPAARAAALGARPDRRLRAAGRRRARRSSGPAVMGALGVLATLAGRRASRLYALALAAVVTLAIDPGRRRRRRLAAQLRRRGRDPPARRAAARGDRGADRLEGLAPRAGRGRRGDDRRDAGHRAADRLPLRHRLDHDPRRQPAGDARGGAGDVAGDARSRRGPGPRLPGRGVQRPQRAPARLHRPGRRLVRPAGLGVSARAARRRRPGRLLRRRWRWRSSG